MPRLWVLTAGEQPVAGRKQLIADAVARAQEWFRTQTGGRHPLFKQDPDGVSVATVKLSSRGGSISSVLADIYGKLGSTGPLAVFGEGDFPAAGSGGACGHGGWYDVMLSLRRCSRQYPRQLDLLVAHEVVHMQGAVSDCAPNEDHYRGHVDDDRRDIVFYQHTGMGLSQRVLDGGRDDYYGHGRADCHDIARNPLLASPVPEAGAESQTTPQTRWQPTEETIDAVHRVGAPRLRDEVLWINEGAWCTGATSTSVSLSWLDLGGVARTEVTYGRSFDASQGRFDLTELRGATRTSATIEGLQRDVSYNFGVVTYGADGAKLDRFHTKCQTANYEFLACPQTHTTETSLRFEWDPIPGAEGYVVARYEGLGVGKDVFGVFTVGTSLVVDGLAPGVRYRFLLFPLTAISAEDPNNMLADKVFSDWGDVEDIAETIAQVIDVSDIPGFPDGSPPYAIGCRTLPENAKARCADVGATSLTYEWDPVPGTRVYVVRIDAYLHNRVNNHYWTTGTSWTFDGLVPGRTYDISVEAYPAHYLDHDDAIAPGQWITDDWAADAGAYVDVDSMVPGFWWPSMHIRCQTQRLP